MKYVIVTGGAGYIGSHACKALARAGYTPVTYDNLSTGNAWSVRWGPLECGDILDATRIDEVFAKYRPVGVLHFAALSLVGESMSEPGRYRLVNVGGTRTVADAAIAHGNVPMVFSSTCAVYGEPDRLPLTERAPTMPINPYGATKLEAEALLAHREAVTGLRSMRLRYFNAAGADPDGEIGEARDCETHLIPLTLGTLTGRRSSISIMGTDYDTPDGTAVRDYIHVSDLAEAHVAAIGRLIAGGDSATLNIGTGVGASVRDVVRAVERVSGRNVPTILAGRRDGDAPALYADASLARTVLDPLTTSRSTLGEIVRTAWAWERQMMQQASTSARLRTVRSETRAMTS